MNQKIILQDKQNVSPKSSKKYRVGLCGTVSCGKTTLVKSLSQLPQFKNYYISTERSKYLRDLGIPLNNDSTVLGQSIFLAERASELLNTSLITDRTIIDVMAFTSLSTSMECVEKHNFIEYAKYLISHYDYIFYISPEGVELEDNGVRIVNNEYRNLIDEEIKSLLIKYSHLIKNLTYIKGTNEERIEQVLKTINL